VLVDGAGQARLGDFGLSTFGVPTLHQADDLAVTVVYAAPELLDPERYWSEVPPENLKRKTKKSDIYSPAITAWAVRP
jgi:serine/threonine protein kinase